MKKLNTGMKISEIHISELDDFALIQVKKDRKILAFIMKDSNENWICSTVTKIYLEDPNLSDLLDKPQLKGCEFYVIDNEF